MELPGLRMGALRVISDRILVVRNRARFPRDFAFLLTTAETAEVVANLGHLSIGPILAAIRQLTLPPESPKRRRIGFL